MKNVPRHIDGGLADVAAGVVHQDIDVAVVGVGLFHAALDAVVVAHIEFQRQGAHAEGLDLLLELAQALAVAAGDHQVGARPCQCPGHVLAKTAARARDDGHLARQVEWVLAHGA